VAPAPYGVGAIVMSGVGGHDRPARWRMAVRRPAPPDGREPHGRCQAQASGTTVTGVRV